MGGKLEGLSFCITGALESFKNRNETHQIIQDHGGIKKTGVTKNLFFVDTNIRIAF